MNQNCNLCNDSSSVLKEFPHYKVITEKYPIEKGTVLIVTKDHLACHAVGLHSYYEEFIEIKKQISNFLNLHYGKKIIFFEHGVVGQTIPHAHLHCIPSKSLLHPIVSIENPENQVIDYSQLPELYRKFQEYYLLEENNCLHFYKPDNRVRGYFRIKLAESLKRPELADWHTFSDLNLLQSTEKTRQHWTTTFS